MIQVDVQKRKVKDKKILWEGDSEQVKTEPSEHIRKEEKIAHRNKIFKSELCTAQNAENLVQGPDFTNEKIQDHEG